jgi:hypothetical protein
MKLPKYQLKSSENLTINTSKVPLVIIDKRLNDLDNVILFPEKVEQAKQIIRKIGLPKEMIKFKLNLF